MDLIKTVWSYILHHIALIISFLLIVAMFIVVFWLYGVSLEPIIYSAVLSAVTLIIIGAIRFSAYYKRHKRLSEIMKNVDYILDGLPKPSGLIEEDYVELVKRLNKNKNDIVSAFDLKYRDMIDYYTLWAHQIKTPIAAMRLLLQSADSEENSELDYQLFKIEQYVEMVLQYLRSDNISSDIELKQYELDGIVRQAVKKFRKEFLRKKVSVDVAELNCSVLTDEKWLLFVVEQVISNSLKYTNEGKISIYMDKDSEKTLVITDTGIGIRPEDLPRVFEKGFTGYNGRADKKSTGIGLFLCKKVLNRLSHTISIDSELSRGTIVKIGLATEKLEVE